MRLLIESWVISRHLSVVIDDGQHDLDGGIRQQHAVTPALASSMRNLDGVKGELADNVTAFAGNIREPRRPAPRPGLR